MVKSESKRVRIKYTKVTEDMFNEILISMRTSEGITNEFSMKICLYQGLALRSYLFAVVMDDILDQFKMKYLDVCLKLMQMILI